MENIEKGFEDQSIPKEEISQVEITPEITQEIGIINGALEILENEKDGSEKKKPPTIH